jgi:hypothetical protein
MHALEHGNWNAAITAAERSVRLDATDGEAWLILGGAYQERGSDRAARHARRAQSPATRDPSARPLRGLRDVPGAWRTLGPASARGFHRHRQAPASADSLASGRSADYPTKLFVDCTRCWAP